MRFTSEDILPDFWDVFCWDSLLGIFYQIFEIVVRSDPIQTPEYKRLKFDLLAAAFVKVRIRVVLLESHRTAYLKLIIVILHRWFESVIWFPLLFLLLFLCRLLLLLQLHQNLLHLIKLLRNLILMRRLKTVFVVLFVLFYVQSQSCLLLAPIQV